VAPTSPSPGSGWLWKAWRDRGCQRWKPLLRCVPDANCPHVSLSPGAASPPPPLPVPVWGSAVSLKVPAPPPPPTLQGGGGSRQQAVAKWLQDTSHMEQGMSHCNWQTIAVINQGDSGEAEPLLDRGARSHTQTMQVQAWQCQCRWLPGEGKTSGRYPDRLLTVPWRPLHAWPSMARTHVCKDMLQCSTGRMGSCNSVVGAAHQTTLMLPTPVGTCQVPGPVWVSTCSPVTAAGCKQQQYRDFSVLLVVAHGQRCRLHVDVLAVPAAWGTG
jgi:hypothetical protein